MNNNLNILKSKISGEKSVFSKTLIWTGIAFGAICLIGLFTWLIVDHGGLLKGLNELSRYNFSKLYNFSQQNIAIQHLMFISFGAVALIFVSSILRMIWMFRVMRASKIFIYSNFTLYVIAQELGFGVLFTIWRSQEILTVFGIASIAFISIAIVGYKSKNLSKLLPFLIVGSILVMIMSAIAMILYFMHIYNDKFIFVWTVLMTILILGYIAYDVWKLKKTSEWFATSQNNLDPLDKFRIMSWLSFRLLSDFIALIWIVAMWVKRLR